MKTLLFMSALMLASVSSSAQSLTKVAPVQKTSSIKFEKLSAAPVNVANRQEAKATATPSVLKAPKKVIADEVWYQRPEGSFYISGGTNPNYYAYLYMPAFTDVTYVNKSADKSISSWRLTYNTSSTPIEPNEDFDAVVNINKIAEGYISPYYIPELTVGEKTYTFGENISNNGSPNNADVAVINGDTISSMTQCNLSSGYYTGFSDAAIFGTRVRDLVVDEDTITARCTAIYEFYKKPIKPLYVTDIWFRVVNYEDTPLMNEDTEMMVTIKKVDEEGNIGDVIAEMPFTLADAAYDESDEGHRYGAFIVSQKESDAFGTEYEVPFVIEDDFVIIISGFEQEDVNFSLYMCDVMGTETDFYDYDGFVVPTQAQYINAETGELIDRFYNVQYINKATSDKYNEEDGDNYDWTRQFNAVIYIDGMEDVAMVEDGYDRQTAPVAGGAFEADVEMEDDDGNIIVPNYIEISTTMPWVSTWEGQEGEDNYYIINENEEEDFPEWIEVTGYNDEYYEDYDVTLIQFSATELPSDVLGRQARIRIVSDKGAMSNVITLTQGDSGAASIKTVANKETTKSGKSYNLAGQRISKSFKGITVVNGHKVIRK